MSPYEPRLVNFVDLCDVLVPMASTILPSSLVQDSSSLTYCLAVGLCISFHHLLDEVSMMTIGLETNLSMRIQLGIIAVL